MSGDRPAPPSHHDPAGGFRNPWGPPPDRSFGRVLRWSRERRQNGISPDPHPSQLPTGRTEILQPRAATGDLRLTWVGHATFLIQIGPFNVLSDPHWSQRASPFQWAGPARFVPPGVPFDRLPPIDAILLSHDHYDHLDTSTVRRIARTWPDASWYVPLGYRDWLARQGVRVIAEMDWWETAAGGQDGALRIQALPAQHWTRRGLSSQQRLWASWSLRTETASVFFGGDSGYCAGFAEIGQRVDPFDALLIPIGAYEPRWFMKHDHMDPAEAVQTYRDLGGTGLFAGMHWGTFRLTDEDPLEPPRLLAREWERAGLPLADLWIPRHGETHVVR